MFTDKLNHELTSPDDVLFVIKLLNSHLFVFVYILS
uniref:Uncharacterized protein n=1 Tax=Arundo donax TaxID=35708 RepID=A0A0A8ZIB3_ARUDO